MKQTCMFYLYNQYKQINVRLFVKVLLELEPIIIKKLELLKEGGFNLRSEIQLYCYIDSDKEFDSGLYRANRLKELGTNAFIMFNPNSKQTKRIIDLQRWANLRMAFWGCSFEQFRRRTKK